MTVVEGEFVRLLEDDGTWQAFQDDWRAQCEPFEEDFDTYAEATFSAVREIIEKEKKKAGVFALRIEGKHVAMCQINTAAIPRYDAPVMRVRFITLSPEFDLAEKEIEDYANVMVELLTQVVILSRTSGEMKTRYIKFHLRSPADRQFFTAFGKGLHESKYFDNVATQGAWLYISQK
ncbi:hypothetical protein [Rhizobium rhizogenes]|uniref:hypothetical protein n=1 Tax=Rhizobium rhizogenes TaxID=359 RepID=UPI001572D00E|nr:hypothetical protein [Rhizobium rhizogenes]NTF43056.1 hypothetical protein [Rhizobium rhizogenes]